MKEEKINLNVNNSAKLVESVILTKLKKIEWWCQMLNINQKVLSQKARLIMRQNCSAKFRPKTTQKSLNFEITSKVLAKKWFNQTIQQRSSISNGNNNTLPLNSLTLLNYISEILPNFRKKILKR